MEEIMFITVFQYNIMACGLEVQFFHIVMVVAKESVLNI